MSRLFRAMPWTVPARCIPKTSLIKPEAEFMGFYMRMLRDTFGIEGRYHESARLREVAA